MRSMACREACGLGVFILFSGPAAAQYQEPGAEALHQFTGVGGFGWAASELDDITGDGVMEAMISSTGAFGGYIDVYDGCTGALLRQLRGTDFGVTPLGWALANAGDVDGDGVPDIIGSANSSGAVLLISGDDFSLIHRVNQTSPGEQLGYAVAGVGDVNGDGFADVIAGAPLYDIPGAGNIGRVYVISGIDGSVLDTVQGETAADQFGSATAAIGDITGDGVGDFAVGAKNAGTSAKGAVYIYDGATRALLFPRIEPLASGSGLGEFFVGPAGDADADGTPDIYAGDFNDSTLGPRTGRCYVISGATGQVLWTRPGSASGQELGCGRGAGDVNFDGHDDIVVGSYKANNGGNNAGRVQVLSGADGSVIRTITNTVVGQQFGFDAVGIGDVSGDGLIDLLVAAGGGNAGAIVRGELACLPDVNLTGAPTPADFNAWIIAFNNNDHKADQNLDGIVSPADFNAWIINFNVGC